MASHSQSAPSPAQILSSSPGTDGKPQGTESSLIHRAAMPYRESPQSEMDHGYRNRLFPHNRDILCAQYSQDRHVLLELQPLQPYPKPFGLGQLART